MPIGRTLVAALLVPGLLGAQARRPSRTSSQPGDLSVVAARYLVRIDPNDNVFRVRAEFTFSEGRDTVLLSLPAWTPGNYVTDNYARWVHGVSAEADGRAAFWDKLDKDTWRIAARGSRTVALEFQTNPDSVMLEFSAIFPDFAFMNGTNLLVYPEGAGFDWPAELHIEAPQGWRLATGLSETAPGRFRADNYHDLVDCPVFAGRLAVDSVIVDGKPIRFVMYPDTVLTRPLWDSLASTIRRLAAAQNRIFGGPPYDSYTVLFYAPWADLSWGGGLEHHDSQFDVIPAPGLGDRRTGQLGPFTSSLLSHESFHLFNVKRIRPAELWPYDYGREQYTPLLWWSEGVTDYYGDVTATRSGVWSLARFLSSVQGNISQVEDAAEVVSAEDASINTWIHPTFVDEAQYYYPKGSLLGLMLDIRIREATGGQHSLDDVMRALWQNHWLRGRSFTTQDLLGYIRQWFPGVDDFYARYINGREPLPYRDVLPRAGIAVNVQEALVPLVGVVTGEARDGGTEIARVFPGSLAAEAGLRVGDILLTVGEVRADDPAMLGFRYRMRYRDAEGQQLVLTWRREGQQMTGRGTVRLRTARSYRVALDPGAPAEARAILEGILRGER